MAERMRKGPRAQQEQMLKAQQARELRCPKHPHARLVTGPTIPTGKIATWCDECHRLAVSSSDAQTGGRDV
jgi:hypothetical protein